MKEDIFTKPYKVKGGKMAAPKPTPSSPAPPKEEPIKLVKSPYIPSMAYNNDTEIPGYWMDDIKLLLHPEDYKELLATVEDVFEENGRKKVYALTYIRWLNEPHKD